MTPKLHDAPGTGEAPPPGKKRPSARRKLLLSAVALAFSFVVAEGLLRVAGIEIMADRLVRDPVLGWRNRPGYVGETFRVNSRGFLGPELELEKAPGVVRVVCLGDSCTAGDLLDTPDQTYPRQLASALAERYPTRTFEVINAGVGSYSSFQGRAWLEQELIHLRPNVLVVYFGWNDHWQARTGGTDREVSGSAVERVRAWLGWSKVVQLFVRAWRQVRGRRAAVAVGRGDAGGAAATGTLRVPVDEYEANLKAMVELVRRKGGQVILLTAASYLELGTKRGIADVAESLGGDASAVQAVNRVHRQYNERVREVAQATGACLVDVARLFESEGMPQRLFWRPAPQGGKAI
ncbi:hypothetical protein HQ576_01770, partial [bacterium]|nr:hypothetical protein [bacterium]